MHTCDHHYTDYHRMCKFMQILDLFDEHKQKITKFGHSHLHTLRCWAPLQSQPVPPEMQQQDCSNLRICESKGLIMLRALFVLTQGIQWYPLSKHCKHNYGMSLSCPSLKLPWKWHTISIINHDISSTILNIYYCIYFTYITHSYILVKCNPAGILHIRSDPGISDQAQAWTSKNIAPAMMGYSEGCCDETMCTHKFLPKHPKTCTEMSKCDRKDLLMISHDCKAKVHRTRSAWTSASSGRAWFSTFSSSLRSSKSFTPVSTKKHHMSKQEKTIEKTTRSPPQTPPWKGPFCRGWKPAALMLSCFKKHSPKHTWKLGKHFAAFVIFVLDIWFGVP